ncbi:Amine N-MethylTransferase, partial [Trichostrongylus colubriformis]
MPSSSDARVVDCTRAGRRFTQAPLDTHTTRKSPRYCNWSMRPVSDVPASQEIIDRDKFLTEFRTDAYLRDFYTKVEDPAMQMVLNCLPNIVTRLGNVKRVLDFGAGPTIHVAASFRNQATEIYLADYLPQNRKELSLWCEGRSDFDWSEPLKMILSQEGNSWSDLDQMIALTRKKICGVYHCDCFASPSVEMPAEMQGTFEVVVTIFCVEYCCKTYEEYKNAIKNIVDQIRPGGTLHLSIL